MRDIKLELAEIILSNTIEGIELQNQDLVRSISVVLT